MILNADKIQDALRLKHKDDNILHQCHDTARAMEVARASLDGKAIGSCVQENGSFNEVLKTQECYKKVHLIHAFITSPVTKRQIYHCVNIVKMNNDRWYMYNVSNGMTKRVPFHIWYDANPMKICHKEEEKDGVVRFIQLPNTIVSQWIKRI